MGSRSHDIFGADLMILRILSSDIVRKKSKLFLSGPRFRGSTSIDANQDLNLAIFTAKYLPNLFARPFIVLQSG